ncbi:hypothetical protein FRB99_003465 [Tulasnella sp. 403]|nr:hypothetical protein FRB99_003465 [Tulasnella sp. 403]
MAHGPAIYSSTSCNPMSRSDNYDAEEPPSGVIIGARQSPSSLPNHSEKGDTGVTHRPEEDEGVFSMSPSETTSPLANPSSSWNRYSMEPEAHDAPASRSYDNNPTLPTPTATYPDSAKSSYQQASPYLSTPETPISFQFSPHPRYRQFTHPDTQKQSYFQSHVSSLPHSYISMRQDSLMTDMSEEPLSTPSTSYASSSKVPPPAIPISSSFLYLDQIEHHDVKGKGKGKEREVSPPSTIEVGDHTLPPAPEPSTPVHDDIPSIKPDDKHVPSDSTGSLPSSVDSLSPPKPKPSHIGLSFQEQRYTLAPQSRIREHFAFLGPPRRSHSSHSHRREPTPVPSTSRSRSRDAGDRHSLRRKRPSLRKLFSLASRGRTFRRLKGKRANRAQTESIPTSSTPANPVAQASSQPQQSSVHGPLLLSPVPAVTPPPQTLESFINATLTTAAAGQLMNPEITDDNMSDAGGSSTSGSTTIKWSSIAAAASTHADTVEDPDEAPAGSIIIASSSTAPPPPSILVSNLSATAQTFSDSPEEASRDNISGAGDLPFYSQASPRPPPRLRFVGRANTSPAPPHAEVSSEVASGSSGTPVAAYYQHPAVVSPIAHRPHSNSVLTSITTISGPETSAAYTYIHTLPPLPRVIPHPDGSAQLMDDYAASPVASTYSPPLSMSRTSNGPKDLFDTILPYELRVEVFRHLLQQHIEDHAALLASRDWSVGAAAGGNTEVKKGRIRQDPARWVGFERGVRELVKLQRVCRAWQQLSLDGQLWASTSFVNFPHVPAELLIKITQSVGPFMKTLDLRGVTAVTGLVLMDLVENVRAFPEGAVNAGGPDPLTSTWDRSTGPYSSLRQRARLSPPPTMLTTIQLSGCSGITTRSLNNLLSSSPFVEVLNLKGLLAVTNSTCEIIGHSCSTSLVKLDMSKCANISASGMEDMVGNHGPSSFRSFSAASHPRYSVPARRFPKLKELRAAGLKRVNGQTMFSIGWGLPNLEVLDLSSCKTLEDDDIEAFVRWDERFDDAQVLNTQVPLSRNSETPQARNGLPYQKITLTSREMGLNPMSTDKYHRRLTKLRHLSLSSCTLLTDAAAASLAFCLPKVEFFEMGGIGAGIRDLGLVKLFATTPWIRRVDLEDATEITDDVLHALIPPPPPPLVDQRRQDVDLAAGRPRRPPPPRVPAPGEFLEQIILSYAGNLSDAAFLAMIHGCTKLKVMELDNTRASDQVVKEFVKTCRRRQMQGAEVLAVDCRNVTRAVFGEGTGSSGLYLTRNRRGYRSWEARNLGYYDERDKKDKKSGWDAITGSAMVGDECDESRVVVKTFHSWQAVDNMVAARERRRRALLAKAAETSGEHSHASGGEGSRTPRWLPWRGAHGSGTQTPVGGIDLGGDDRGCVIM